MVDFVPMGYPCLTPEKATARVYLHFHRRLRSDVQQRSSLQGIVVFPFVVYVLYVMDASLSSYTADEWCVTMVFTGDSVGRKFGVCWSCVALCVFAQSTSIAAGDGVLVHGV